MSGSVDNQEKSILFILKTHALFDSVDNTKSGLHQFSNALEIDFNVYNGVLSTKLELA